ncbi:xanthosine utilization system XapX-like protein [Microbacterium sp. W4I4]|uniref:hypothetical protein n=1 Tax=Microbacterium sp. W4I4 TaxID=3042295 RepID=UPI0027883F3C|nr:hypothetical protein [Microbacterium sp. W4I4]MDQ0615973.1 xanthosine utilization system XapX-like protein [Microbacterium sp. W4I4]
MARSVVTSDARAMLGAMTFVDPFFSAVLSSAIIAVLLVVLVLSLANVRKPTTAVMAVAGVLVAAAVTIVIVLPPAATPLLGIPLTVLGFAAATIGGNPFTRRALDIATGKRVRETEDGGILIIAAHDADPAHARTLMRGGTVIGYLERICTVVAIAVGFPEAIAAIIAVKGIGRFPELAESEARERFIIGTLASLLWSGAIGTVIRLALI